MQWIEGISLVSSVVVILYIFGVARTTVWRVGYHESRLHYICLPLPGECYFQVTILIDSLELRR